LSPHTLPFKKEKRHSKTKKKKIFLPQVTMSDNTLSQTTMFLWYPLLVLSNGYIAVELMRRIDAFEEECPGYYNDDLCYATSGDKIATMPGPDGTELKYEKKRHVNIDTVRNVGYVVLILLALAVVFWGVIVGIFIKQQCVKCDGSAGQSKDMATFNWVAKFLAVICLVLTIFSASYVFYFNDAVRACASHEWKRDEDSKTKENQYQMASDIACISIGLSVPSIITIMYRTFNNSQSQVRMAPTGETATASAEA